MTKKDYVKIADVLRERLSVNPAHSKEGSGWYRKGIELVAGDLAIVLTLDNPRFDRARFYKACGLEGTRNG